MQKTIDTIHHYKRYLGCASRCRIRIYQDPERTPVVIATELQDNEGTSITNMAERLASEWSRDEQTGQPTEIIWIEHYPAERLFKETFALVTFGRDERGEFTTPQWQHITRAEVEQMIGEAVS